MAHAEAAFSKLQGGHSDGVLCVDSNSDGSRIISGAEGVELCIWSSDCQLVHKLHSPDEDSACTSVCISKQNDNMFYAAIGTVVKVFDVRNMQSSVESFQFNEEEVNQIVLDEKEHYLAACDDTGEVKIISLQEKRLYKTLRRKHTNICATVCFRSKKPWEIFSGGMDCNLIHWDFSRPKTLNQFNMQELHDAPSELGAYMVNPPFVHHLSMSSDSHFLACALENGYISIFDSSKKNISEFCTLHAHTQGVSQVVFIGNTKLVTGGNDSVIRLWDLAKMHETESFEVQSTNGHAAPLHNRNSEITSHCCTGEIQHNSKINWLKCFTENGSHFLLVADQTNSITLMPIHV
ncbi:WD repeat-containing protein 53-like isoform X2 [Dreissena polymorpha]|uniref:WD repeat-containing protein 53 n=2 Tax=Dreissena polymorpha TaxID=45954 RepID=A0A9D4FXG2_DREPO|nr:WD repeat-containing protein 53-like isoform X2 [Dreissena polymorpha]XP_052219226.1 WD repeat-containing protein 53-like isoform X2 [Dreissena polymorpha]XP_052219227.1 WD repeat-containing protein 53-like isoform X2 [Dreissena polymorpha]XP_052219228.1 WD repeat-containing protein 53-like isoform X2 [Dreissena polymorpha]KAH3804913.1 hypothetical protein DPMN_133206 [Dreissena polymorpha]